jgi:hypothetical protein
LNVCARTICGTAVGFARFAPLGFIFETLVGKKHLFAGGENEFSRTFGALKNPIVVFHTLLRNLLGEDLQRNKSRLPTLSCG